MTIQKVLTVPKKLYLFDTDASGIAYHSKYLDWLEMARVEYLTGIYKPYDAIMTEDNMSFVPIDIHISYRAPVRFEETIELNIWVESYNKFKLFFACHMVKLDGTLVSASVVELISVNNTTKRPCKISPDLISAIVD